MFALPPAGLSHDELQRVRARRSPRQETWTRSPLVVVVGRSAPTLLSFRDLVMVPLITKEPITVPEKEQNHEDRSHD